MSQAVRPAFLLHVRYNFRNPQLKQRDHTAIEHQVSHRSHHQETSAHVQLRRMSKTLEMLSEPSVQRISVSEEMQQWWQDEINRVNTNRPTSHAEALQGMKSGEKDVRERGDSDKDEAQWGHTLPGHGGT